MNPAFRAFASVVVLLSLAATASGDASAPVTEFFGELSDPVGDSTQFAWEPASRPAPDLVHASARVADGQLDLSVQLAPGTFLNDVIVEFSLDMDANPATGRTTTSNDFFDVDVMGVEYFVDIEGSAFGGQATLLQYTGPPKYSFALIASDLEVQRTEDGLMVSVPLALLGDDDGRLHFKAVTAVRINDIHSWPISDSISDFNLQPGSTVPAAEEIADLGDAISDLETSGSLNQGPARAISNHLENALRALDAGHTSAARAQLEAFIEQVLELVADGTLTAEEAEPLIATAERLLAGL
jgi:hypothetical protein